MRLRNTLFLFAVFILLGAYIYFFELPGEPKREREKLLPFKEEEVHAVVLKYQDHEIRLRKSPSGHWSLTQPLEADADESTVSALLSSLEASEIQRTIVTRPSGKDLATFGLDKPWVKVLLRQKKGSPPPLLLLGARTPVGHSIYAKRANEPSVLLTNASLRSSLDRTLYDFRDKRILKFKDHAVKQLALERATGRLVLTKKGDGWLIEEPRPYRADRAQIEKMISALNHMRAQDFIEEPSPELGKYGLEDPRLRVTLSTGGEGGKREILFGNPREEKQQVYVILDSKGTIYTVDDTVFERLDRDLAALRDKRILRIDPNRVARLEIVTPQGTLTLVRRERGDGEWEQPGKGKVRAGAVADYLRIVGNLRAKGFVDDEPEDLEPYGLASPVLRISVKGAEKEKLAILLVGKKMPGAFYAKRAGGSTVYAIEESSYRQLKKKASDFLEGKRKAGPSQSKSQG